jgi:hypothetical protein
VITVGGLVRFWIGAVATFAVNLALGWLTGRPLWELAGRRAPTTPARPGPARLALTLLGFDLVAFGLVFSLGDQPD